MAGAETLLHPAADGGIPGARMKRKIAAQAGEGAKEWCAPDAQIFAEKFPKDFKPHSTVHGVVSQLQFPNGANCCATAR
ncbi:hypothetical protein S23_04060 [Bradyrhizobium cosmicum]|uniref:Uncharacterized protein n=1 Tax=Bradyrhizobium cosmicum TaxID=1404864 RepID=A0AAI8Q9W9_9BRAD|nr:hypothetical protein S23_04060 [Bradyrhizobium cosmicum]